MKRRFFLSSLAASSAATISPNVFSATEFELTEGVQYKKLSKPVDTNGKKTVVEVFGYTCPHCYNLEPSIHKWLKTKPSDVAFERMPVVFNHPNWIYMARVFFAAKRLGVLDKAHTEFFHAIHRDKTDVYTPEALGKFFNRFGVAEKDFIAMFESFVVDGDVKRAAKLTRQYQVEGVPAVVVNGKFLTDVPMAKGKQEMWSVVNRLTQK